MTQFLRIFSDEKHYSDQLFFFAFYLCIGFLPPLIGILGSHVVAIPILIIATLIVVRFFIRPECQRRMVSIARQPESLLLFAFMFLILGSALSSFITMKTHVGIFLKPLAFFLAIMPIFYVWSHKDILNKTLLFKLVLAGFLTGFLINTVKLFINLSYGIGATYSLGDQANNFNADYTVNQELTVLSIMAFVATFAIKGTNKRIILVVIFVLSILLCSLYTFQFYRSNDFAIMVWVKNETIQYGLVIALVCLALSYKIPDLMSKLFFYGFIVLLCAAPWLFVVIHRILDGYPHLQILKIMVRTEIWEAVALKVFEAPFFGHGLDSIRYLNNIDMVNKYMPQDNLLHPHNVFLQLWIDLGVAGILIVLSIFLMGWRFINKINLSERPIILAGFAMLTIFGMVNTSLWRTWVLMLLSCFFTIFYLFYSSNQKSSKTSK